MVLIVNTIRVQLNANSKYASQYGTPEWEGIFLGLLCAGLETKFYQGGRSLLQGTH